MKVFIGTTEVTMITYEKTTDRWVAEFKYIGDSRKYEYIGAQSISSFNQFMGELKNHIRQNQPNR